MAVPDLSLVLVLASLDAGERPPAAVAFDAVAGGITAVQFAGPHLPDGEAYVQAEGLATACRRLQVPLLIHRRADLALAVGADGLCVERDGLPVPVVRRLLGSGRWIGVYVESEEEAETALLAGADFLLAGPVYSGGGREPLGPELVRRIRSVVAAHAVSVGAAACPVVAVGGISAWNCVPVLQAGADGLGVGRAVAGAPDVQAAARTLRRLVGEWQ